MKFVIAAVVVILGFWLLNSSLIDRHAPELDGPIGWRNAYSLRGSALAENSPDSNAAANEALSGVVDNSGSPAAVIPNTGQRVYTVQPGDTLGSIAVRFGVTVGQILYANPAIQNANLIYAGQPIVIPPPGSPSVQIADPSIISAAAVQAPTAAVQAPTSAVNSPTAAVQAPTADPPVVSIPVTAGEAANTASPAVSNAAAQPSQSQQAHVPAGRWIFVDLAAQRVTAYYGNAPVRTFIVSTGIPAYPTNPGVFQIYEKYDAAEMIGQGYDLQNVPYVMYYEQGGYALHGTYWHNNFGTPMSHGCVNLATQDAEWLYNWAPLGTTVVIQ